MVPAVELELVIDQPFIEVPETLIPGNGPSTLVMPEHPEFLGYLGLIDIVYELIGKLANKNSRFASGRPVTTNRSRNEDSVAFLVK
jgi:hypothetical protein